MFNATRGFRHWQAMPAVVIPHVIAALTWAGPPLKDCCRDVPGRAASLLLCAASQPAEAASEPSDSSSHATSKVDVAKWPPKPWPEGMVWIPGGEFTMGGVDGDSDARPDEYPAHRVRVDGFWMDQTEVTVGQFKKFVAATGFKTIAEKTPDWEELKKQVAPGTPKPDASLLVAGSMVFTPTDGPVSLEGASCWHQWWSWVPGADWKHPLGPRSNIDSTTDYDHHPVVHICWEDTAAYCRWAGKRLPTEAEWEFACRGGEERKRFIWGDDAPSDTNIKANLWQGAFPYEKKPADKFLLTAPVKSFPPNGYGLYDMIGNVWEWCGDWYHVDAYKQDVATAGPGKVIINPKGPEKSFDPSDPHAQKRVNRGGSFLCNSKYCASYRPSARMRTSSDTGQNHLGFRCVMSQEDWRKLAATRVRSPDGGASKP